MKKFLAVLLVLVLSISLVACGNGGEEVVDDVGEESDVLVDRAGLETVAVKKTESIISLAPSVTEILVDMGYGENLVAADSPESQSREGVPQDIVFLDIMSPDVEQIISLKPDVVFATTMSFAGGEDPLQAVKDEGISVVNIPSSNSIEEIYKDILFIGEVLNDEEGSQALVDNMKEQIEEVRERNKDAETKTVYFEIAAAPDMYSFGSGTFISEMLEILGFENILGDNESWMSVSEEIILAGNPDLVFTNVTYIEEPVNEILSREGWESITAVANEDVYHIDNSGSSLPNHNIVRALLEMEEAVR